VRIDREPAPLARDAASALLLAVSAGGLTYWLSGHSWPYALGLGLVFGVAWLISRRAFRRGDD
jgi:hypothetical protein